MAVHIPLPELHFLVSGDNATGTSEQKSNRVGRDLIEAIIRDVTDDNASGGGSGHIDIIRPDAVTDDGAATAKPGDHFGSDGETTAKDGIRIRAKRQRIGQRKIFCIDKFSAGAGNYRALGFKAGVAMFEQNDLKTGHGRDGNQEGIWNDHREGKKNEEAVGA
jgi:hypothetical protein